MLLQDRDVREVLKTYLKSEDFEIISFKKAELDGISAGYLSAQNKARIRFKTNRGESELHIFMKILPDSTFHRQNILTMGSFRREVIIFTEILNKYNDFLKDNTIPSCYLAKSDEIIVLDDMSKKGFKNKPTHETLDLHHCEKAIESLAKFHALSFITEKTEGRKIIDIVPIIKNEIFVPQDENSVYRKATLASIKCIKTLIEKYMAHVPADVVGKAFRFLDNFFKEMKSSELYPNVLSHADLWTNNVMFKYDERGNVAEACILDFQLVAYKAPGFDIQFFLYASAEKDMRNRHMDHLMSLYYDILKRTLRSAGMNLEGIMSYHDFDNMLKETVPVVLAQVCICLTSVLIPESIAKEIMSCDETFKTYFEENRTDYVMKAMMTDKEFNKRIVEAVSNFINYFSCH